MKGLRSRTFRIYFLNLKNTIFTDYEKMLTTFYPCNGYVNCFHASILEDGEVESYKKVVVLHN